ncbi:MAG TPA: lipoprotein-releasing system ATP-binding protein LolD [Spirochaetia bacterium]|nr:lipoprotein-releasing system ATP-binding protein LolD [Spirochaetia bacterium]
MNVVELKNISKLYLIGNTEVKAIKKVDLEIKKSDFISIVGPSGSGKTSLLNIIGCLDKPTNGEVKILGEDVNLLNDEELSYLRNHRIGFIFQSFNLIPVLTAFENIEYPLILAQVNKKERKEKAEKMLEEVGLINFKNHRPNELSGGQKQRVAIARALVTNPELVLADEPSANIDSETGEVIIEIMKKMNKNFSTTFIFSTHDERIMKHAQKIIKIRDGLLCDN